MNKDAARRQFFQPAVRQLAEWPEPRTNPKRRRGITLEKPKSYYDENLPMGDSYSRLPDRIRMARVDHLSFGRSR